MLFVSVTPDHIEGIKEKERIRVKTTDTGQTLWVSKKELREINTETEADRIRLRTENEKEKKENQKENQNEQNQKTDKECQGKNRKDS